MDTGPLKNLLLQNDPEFWTKLKVFTHAARDFEELFLLSSLRKKAQVRKLAPAKPPKEKLRLAMLGGYSLQLSLQHQYPPRHSFRLLFSPK